MSWPTDRHHPFREMLTDCVANLNTFWDRYVADHGVRAIRSAVTRDAVCPTWFVGTGSPPHDEADGIDAALSLSKRSQVRAHRTVLLQTLRHALREAPSDDWLAGQLIRFLVDQSMLDSAAAFAKRCAAAQWWCMALRGFVAAKQGTVVESGRLFDGALEIAPDSVRCAWTDHATIVDPAERAPYEKLSCAQRQSFNRKLWWLSDPLFVTSGNERRVEQFARLVLIELRSALVTDERFAWLAQAGGDARQELVTRYGWPSYAYWPGYGFDIFGAGSAGPTHGVRKPANDAYTTYEYSRERASLVPTLRAVDDPYSALSGAWSITGVTAMATGHTSFSFLGDKRILGLRQMPADSALTAGMSWWPHEHMKLGYRLSDLPDGQTAVLRRHDSILVAVATVVPRDSSFTERSELHATLVSTTSEDSVTFVAQRATRPGSRLVMHGQTRPGPAVIGVEVVAGGAVVTHASRVRFGIAPPPPLSALRGGELAVSAPVLLAPLPVDSGEARDATTDEILQRMLATHRVDRPRRIGVYWETYGIAAQDTVDVAVWIERYTPQGLLRRLGAGFGVVPDLNTPVVMQWREPQAGRERLVLGGRVPIVSRTVELDLSTLIPGEYWLDVAVGRVGEPPVRARRGIVIPQ